MWWEVRYEPTSMFSLKISEATNAAGKSLFFPSPYSIKMALINAICTYDSIDSAIQKFDLIKKLMFEYYLPDYLVINNCFLRILQSPHSETLKKFPHLPFISTVAFREYIYFSGEIKLAFTSKINFENEDLSFLKKYFAKINYFGKRGCFFQFKDFSDMPIENLDKNYSRLLSDKEYFQDSRPKILCKIDDFGEKSTFFKVSNYSNEKTDRVSKILCLPFKVIRANKNFTIIKRSD